MEWLNFLKYMLALVFVLGLIGLGAFLLQRVQSGTKFLSFFQKKDRLSVLDSKPIDNKRRLILVQWDDVEHLILAGPQSDIVVDSRPAKEDMNEEIEEAESLSLDLQSERL